MIAVLTILYLVAIWLIYFRLKLLPFNLTNKISVAMAGVVLVFGLLLAMNYAHPHTSDVRQFQYVIPIVPWTPKPAKVIEVSVRPNEPVKAGDVLFRLDPRQYEFEVRRLEATLAAAGQEEPELEQQVSAAQAALDSAKAARENAQLDMDRSERLLAQNAIPRNQYDERQKTLERSEASVRAASADLERAQLAYHSKVNGEFTSVVEVREQLEAAKFDLEQTTVVAPEDGFVTNLQIRPGAIVSPSTAVMSFVSTAQTGVLVATFPQNAMGHIQPGQPVEIAMTMHPGTIFKAQVETVIEASGLGQLTASGVLPQAIEPQPPGRFAIRLKLRDEDLRWPMGASGSAVVYTNTLVPLAVIQKVSIRMESLLNYLVSPL